MTAALRLCVALLACLAAGCGPGVGGTGTGESPLVHFGASAAPVCGADIATTLDCPPGPGAGAPAAAGTARVLLAEGSTPTRATLVAEGNTVELQATCSGLRFSGDWASVAGAPGRYYGRAVQDGMTFYASVVLQAGSGGLELQLQDDGGRVLLGPFNVQRVTTLPAGC